MYDNIVIRLEEGDLPVGYDWQSVLSKSSQRLSYTTGNGVKGVWRGRWVTARNGYIEFKGSLPKCLYEHNCNVKPVTLSEIERLVDEMSADLWNKSVYWQLVSEWLYHFESLQFRMVYDADFRLFKNVTSFEDWAICTLDADYGLIGVVKSLFDTRSEPKPSDRTLHHKLKKRIDKAKTGN